LAGLSGARPPVLIIDSHGRPWRLGTVGVTIGLSGLAPMQDLRGRPDLFGEPLAATDVGYTDQIAAAASLLMGQAAEGCPVVIGRGLRFTPDEEAEAAHALRPKETDLFR
jgi:coenzyme F420-0:L-glutamate ligase/coenzyme F420-1:gamma-L-glutamate ligase